MFKHYFGFLITFFSLVVFAENNGAQFHLLQNNLTMTPGKVSKLEVQVTLPVDYHAYSDQFKVVNLSSPDFHIMEIKITPEIEFFDKFSKKNKKGFKEFGRVILDIEALHDIDITTKNLSFDLRYQICSTQFCYLPKNHRIDLQVHFAEAQISKPTKPLTTDYLQSRLESTIGSNWLLALFIVFIAGILTSFTPCIFPMIPITISILGHQAEKNSRVENLLRSILYVLGIAVTYSLLGIIAALSGKVFGYLLSSKIVMIFMVVLFFTMALSMWGVFEVQVPAFLRNRLGTGKKRGFLGIFIMGLIAGIVASPCVGPVLISILSYVSTTQDVLLGFSLLFTYALGLGLIFIVIGVFGQALSLLPKSGQWMSRIKFFLGVLMVLAGIYYLQFVIPYKQWVNNLISQTETVKAHWVPYSDEALKVALALEKPVMIDFRADWCAACYELDDKTFIHPEFIALSESFSLFKVDASDDTEEVQKITGQYDVKGLPTVIFMNKRGEILKDLTFTQFIDWKQLEIKMKAALNE